MIWIVYIVWGILQILVTALVCLFVMLSYKFVEEKLQAYYRNWKTKKQIRQTEKDYIEYRQRIDKRELEQKLRKEEREKYPLFYWRELENERSTT